MSDPFIGEIRMFGGNFAPQGWAFCDGSTLAIADNSVLFQLIGTTYGGDGQTTFNLPNLGGRIPVCAGSAVSGTVFVNGEMDGSEQVTLTTQQIPAHNHTFAGSTDLANVQLPTGALYATSPQVAMYTETVDPLNKPLNGNEAVATGGNQPHENLMPTLTISFIISLFGIFPSQV